MQVVICPGPVATPNPITLPTGSPQIDRVQAAEIERLPNSVTDHLAADIQAAAPLDNHLAAAVQNSAPIDAHAAVDIQGAEPINVHTQAQVAGALGAHTLNTQAAVGGLVANVLGHDAVPQLQTAAIANVVIAGCISVHAAGAAIVHGYGAGVDVVHAFGAGVPTVHGYTGGAVVTHPAATPVIPAVPAKLSQTTFSLSVNVLAGDLVRLFYEEQGARVHV